MPFIPNSYQGVRFSKMMRDGGRREIFSPGSSLRFARSLDAENLSGKHDGRTRKTGGGAQPKSLSAVLQKRVGSSRKLARRGGARPFGGGGHDLRQRAMVKVHYFTHAGGGANALREHIRYIARDEAVHLPPELSPQQEARQAHDDPRRYPPPDRDPNHPERWVLYDAVSDSMNGARRANVWARGDKRHFRVILSAEFGGEIGNLRDYTREVMARAEQILDTRLDWIAVDHWNTDNPHTHIVIRGRADGRDLRFPRAFIKHGFRNIARDAATERLGQRTPRDERIALMREARAHRDTRLDGIIDAHIDKDGRLSISRLRAPNRDPHLTDALKARAHELRRLGLATEFSRNVLLFQRGWRDSLRAMEQHLDIRRAMFRAQARGPSASPEDVVHRSAKTARMRFGLER